MDDGVAVLLLKDGLDEVALSLCPHYVRVASPSLGLAPLLRQRLAQARLHAHASRVSVSPRNKVKVHVHRSTLITVQVCTVETKVRVARVPCREVVLQNNLAYIVGNQERRQNVAILVALHASRRFVKLRFDGTNAYDYLVGEVLALSACLVIDTPTGISAHLLHVLMDAANAAVAALLLSVVLLNGSSEQFLIRFLYRHVAKHFVLALHVNVLFPLYGRLLTTVMLRLDFVVTSNVEPHCRHFIRHFSSS